MRYWDLRSKFEAAPVLRLQDLSFPRKTVAHESVQLSRWVNQGLLVRLKKGFYALPERGDVDPLWLANQLYFPSYVSLEYVLSQWGIIPEAAAVITSVTARKTKRFTNGIGTFSYQKVTPDYFFGFKTQPNAGRSFYMATPEKAVLDFIYLSIPKSTRIDQALFINRYRFQHLDQLNLKLFKAFLARFTHPRVQIGGAVLLDLMRKRP